MAFPFQIHWNPSLPTWGIIVLGIMSVMILTINFIKGYRKSCLWQGLACFFLILWMANPFVFRNANYKTAPTLLIIKDQSASMTLGNRMELVNAALKQLQETIPPSIKTRTVSIHNEPQQGTRIFSTLHKILQNDLNHDIQGVIILSDGQIHDVPTHALSVHDRKVPIYFMLPAAGEETDRTLQILNTSPYVTIGDKATIQIMVKDIHSKTAMQSTILSLTQDNQPILTQSVPVGIPYTLHIPITHLGETVINLSVAPLSGEISLVNNQRSLTIHGIGKKLKILLVSGFPNQNSRNWRTILKSDPAVELIHFNILRDIQQNDPTIPPQELALVPFPTEMLFIEKLHEFNLVIFDEYLNQNVIPTPYIKSIKNYVKNGGAVLFVTGPEFVRSPPLQNSLLQPILPATVSSSQDIITHPFRPTLTPMGEKHPVTAFLKNVQPTLTPWYRYLKADTIQGTVLLQASDHDPLLILNSVQKGRAALLLSDQLWLWSKKEPESELEIRLLRRLSYWLMKEPALETERFTASIENNRLHIQGTNLLENKPQGFTIVSPSYKSQSVILSPSTNNDISAFFDAPEAGIWKIIHGNQTLYASNSFSDPVEAAELNVTSQKIAPFLEHYPAYLCWLGRDIHLLHVPQVRLATFHLFTDPHHTIDVPENKRVRKEPLGSPLIPAWIILIITLGSLFIAWYKERVSS